MAALGVVTVVATIAAGLLVELYASAVHGTEHSLMVVFAYFFIPQIFFYGLSSLIGAILNTRNSFAAPMWTPIINNVVVIVVGLLFVVTVGLHKTASTVSAGGVLLLGIGTTLGIIVQTVALIPALRKVGFRWRPRFDFRRDGTGRDRPDGDLDAGLRRVHADHVHRHHAAGQCGERARTGRRCLGLQLLIRPVPAAVRHHRRVGDHRAAAQNEQERRRGQILAGA